MASWCRTKVLGCWNDETATMNRTMNRTMPKGHGLKNGVRYGIVKLRGGRAGDKPEEGSGRKTDREIDSARQRSGKEMH